MQRLTQSRNHTELARIVQDAVGSSGLMEFIAFDLGEVDAGSYAPVTILVDERDDGVHLTYETMVSCLRPYGQAAALSVAGDLDAKIQTLLSAAALGRETA
jgi:hypothetical protein